MKKKNEPKTSNDVAVQLGLLLDTTPLRVSRFGRGLTAKEKFERFHEENPHVYRNLVNMAKEAKKNGLPRIGIRQLWETLRCSIGITTGRPYKLNNNYVPHYSRLIMQNEPDLRGLFEVRTMRRN